VASAQDRCPNPDDSAMAIAAAVDACSRVAPAPLGSVAGGGRYLSVLTDLNPKYMFWPRRPHPTALRTRPHSVADDVATIAAIHDIVATTSPSS